MPGRPVTSPAKAGPALNPTMATAHAAAASFDFTRMAFSLLDGEPPRMRCAPSQVRRPAVNAVRERAHRMPVLDPLPMQQQPHKPHDRRTVLPVALARLT